MSAFFFWSLAWAFMSTSLVSAAKPTTYWSGRLPAAKVAKMSGFSVRGTLASAASSRPFFSLRSAGFAGRRSATAAAKMAASAAGNTDAAAASISRAVFTGTTSTPAGAARATGPDTSTTRAPAAAAASAMA